MTLSMHEILESDPQYLKCQKTYNALWKTLQERAPDKVYKTKLFELDSVTSDFQVLAQTIGYEKGFRDGVNLIIECIASDNKRMSVLMNKVIKDILT